MKKGILPLFLAAVLLITGCAYAAIAGQEDTYALYYREADLQSAVGDDALRAEQVQLEEKPGTAEALASSLLTRFLEGPLDETLQSPVPKGTKLLGLKLENGEAQVNLSAAYSNLSGVALTLADYAITLTLTQLEEIDTVRITVLGQELAYRDNQTFQSQDVLLSPKEDVVGTIQVTLYFPNEEGTLVSEERSLDLFEGDTQVEAVVHALDLGPETKGLRPLFPEGFRPKNLWVEEGICYVNISSVLIGYLPRETAARELVLEALCRSLCALEGVEEVRFLIDGEFYGTYRGIPLPVYRDF